jgi:integrase/recombinase XerD
MHRAADDFLRHLLFGRGRAESTTRAYATSVSLYLLWCGQVHLDWWDAVDRLGAFMLWRATQKDQHQAPKSVARRAWWWCGN